MLGKLLKKLRGEAAPPRQLIVRGRITDSGTHTPRTHLGPKQADPEAWFALDVAEARLSDGAALAPKDVVPAEFSGEIGLLERFKIGDTVEITCSTATGRQIERIARAG